MTEHVYVIDDDDVAAAFVAGVASAGGYATTCHASATSFLEQATPDLHGCIVLDLQMEGMTGLELQAELLRRQIFLPVIIVSGQAEVSSAVQAMKQQAFDLFEKPVDPHRLLASIQRAIAHNAVESIRRREAAGVRENYDTLSPREREVMELVVSGLANKQIAARLDLSEKTIEVHRGNVMRKMKVDSLAALVRAAMHCGLEGRMALTQ